MTRFKKRIKPPERSEIDKKWEVDKHDEEDYPHAKGRNLVRVKKYNNGKDYGTTADGKPRLRPGPRKTRPTLKRSDGSEYERLTAEQAQVRGQMALDGIPINRKAKFLSVEEYQSLPKCGAKRKGKYSHDADGNQQYCGNVAGARTNHVGTGRCWLHGGRRQGTQKYKQEIMDDVNIGLQHLTEEERSVYQRIPLSAQDQLESDLRLVTIREARMMKRMNDLIAEGKMAVIEESEEVKGVGDGTGKLDQESVDIKIVKKRSTNLERIQIIEDQLTRLNKQKLSIIGKLEELKTGGSNVNVSISGRKGGSPIAVANLGQIPTEELQRQLDILSQFED